MKITAKQVGELVRATRKSLGVTQKNLAMTSGTGLRFIIELEKGKSTCQIGKVLTVLNTLGVRVTMVAPGVAVDGRTAAEESRGHGPDS